MPPLPDTVPVPLSAAEGSRWPLSTHSSTLPAPLDAVAAKNKVSTGAAFDVCRGALALRALVAVNGAVVLAILAGADSGTIALAALGPAIAVALPATLVWLALVCALRRPLQAMPARSRTLALMALGALLAVAGCLPMFWLQLLQASTPRLIGLALAGATMAGLMAVWLQWREGQRTPADARARLAELQSRIRPHFLFNTLNSAVALVRAEPAKAESLLEDLSDLFRHALVDQGEAVSLEQEVALARRYLGIEQVRFGERLQIEWSIDPAANQARLPPLLLQPLVENAVRHGVEPSAGGAEVRISTLRRGSRVVIKVTNTLPAGPGAQGHGLALQNVRDRLYLLHDLQGQFRSVHRDGLFQVRIEVPA